MAEIVGVAPFTLIVGGKILTSSRICLQDLVRQHANELLHIVDSAGRLSDVGADGTSPEFDKLDALYVRCYIAEALYNPREAVNSHRVTFKITQLMPPGDQRPLIPKGSNAIGLPGHVASAVPACMYQTFSDLVTLVTEQSKPRYIHKYLDETPPYQWDNLTDPARGGFGIIRRATSEITGDVVAIKTVGPCFNNKDRLQVAREIGIVEVCQHPNLLQLLDAYETPDYKIHLVLKPWAPFTLHMFLAYNEQALTRSCPWFIPGKPASLSIVRGILRELADGLHYLHLKSIKHKDIKPENILLHREAHEDVRPIIADFGTSKVFKTGGSTRYTDSTYAYLAPEQVKHTGSSLQSDVWQLGCCFAKILTRACGGYTAIVELNDTYENTKDRRSCTIAMELVHFLPILQKLCASMPDVLEVTCGMLEEDPAVRWTIAKVRDGLQGGRETSLPELTAGD